MCSSAGNKFVDVTTDYLVVDSPYRTALGHHDIRSWEVIELCEKNFPMVTGQRQLMVTIRGC